MQFVVIGRDGVDEQAFDRRMQARPAHLESAMALKESGHLKFATALKDDEDKMVGSVMVLEFEDRQGLDAWLETEPYATESVWQDIEVSPCQIPPLFQ